jgi:hypothetical protein
MSVLAGTRTPVQADDDGDPQALPRDEVDRGTGGEEPPGRVSFAGSEAQLVLGERGPSAIRASTPATQAARVVAGGSR